MKSKIILSMSIAAFVGATLYIPVSAAASMSNEKQPTKAQMKRDGEIIDTLVALNNNEIMMSQEALKKTTNRSVKRYAKMIEREHSKNLNQTLKLSEKLGIAPVETKAVKVLERNGKKETKQLASLNGDKLDKVYVKDMVKDHSAALKLFDNNLLKHASNPELKTLLEKTRPHIAAHLEKAQQLEEEMNIH